MQLASTFTITRGTAAGAEQVGYVDRTEATRAISDLMSALNLCAVEPQTRQARAARALALTQAELILQDWGVERFTFPAETAQ